MNATQGHEVGSNWVRLFLFLLWWSLCAGITYAALVFPFFPEAITASRDEFNKLTQGNLAFLLMSNLASLAGTVGAYAIFKTRYEKTKLFIRLHLSLFGYGAILGALVISLGAVLLLFSKLVSFSFLSIAGLPASLLIYLMVAVAEELVFRGYLLNNLLEKLKPVNAILLSSLIFAVAHVPNDFFGWIGFINIFLSGVLMAIVYRQNNNLSAAVGLHLSWNLFQSLLGFAVSGQKLDGLLAVQYLSNDPALSGGEFGMEGSLLLVPITTALIIVLLWKNGKFWHLKTK